MTETTDTGAKTPWHFWLVAVIAVLWNSFGAYDYTMSQLKGDAYYQQMHMSAAQMAFMHGYPAWMVAVWAIGVWSSFLGALLLLARRRWAVQLFALSVAALAVAIVYTQFLSDGAKAMGQFGLVMYLVLVAACAFFIWYSRLMAKRGVLR